MTLLLFYFLPFRNAVFLSDSGFRFQVTNGGFKCALCNGSDWG